MIRTIVAAASLSLVSGLALADSTAPAGAPDMSKMGPWTRKPTNEKQTKKEIEAFFKQAEAMEKKGDQPGMLAAIDFPVYMVTDDSKGVPTAEEWNQEKYVAVMKPFWENMPKDSKTTHKWSITVLSDSLAYAGDDFTMSGGGHKMSGRNMSLLFKRDGQWKWKSMAEAGWGSMSSPTASADQPKAAPQAAAAK
jgi:acyl-CoA-binding protein